MFDGPFRNNYGNNFIILNKITKWRVFVDACVSYKLSVTKTMIFTDVSFTATQYTVDSKM